MTILGAVTPQAVVQLPPGRPAQAQPCPVDRLEQMFLEEMLKYCGPGALSGGFSGGAGEEQFSSFLTREQAAMLARRLDLGFGALMRGEA